VIEPGATLADDVSIGPYCVVGHDVTLGQGVQLIAHVVIAGHTSIGARTRIFPFASLGQEPQDKKYRGARTRLVIGEDNVIRESVSISTGTEDGGMSTCIGDRNLFMLGSHVAHDCQVADDTVFSNNATLAGHVTVGAFASFSGLCAVHQYCRIGTGAFVGGMTGVERDVIPYGMVLGDRARLVGLNLVGLQRHGATREEIQILQTAYDFLFATDGTLQERVETVATRFGSVPPVAEIVAFLRAPSRRGIVQPAAGQGR
jgi:UDP-N-acetylglucosamine acyltransferase